MIRLTDWVKDSLVDNDFNTKVVKSMYEKAIRDTSSTCTKESFDKYVWRVNKYVR